jgi:replicative superfamily II helicase
MFTVEYSYYQPPFPEYNPVQSAVIPFIDKDVNVVAAFPTATGKTVLAECAFAFHLSQDTKAKVSYVCPFKSLSNEKYREWGNNEQLAPYGVVISTGDRSTDMDRFTTGRISILTAESFDSKMRNVRYRDWTLAQACVVFDEAHIMGDRNGSIETALMKFTKVNPAARIILLSATLGNAKELARWLKNLNGKQTKCFTSEWRPVKIETEIHVVEDGYQEKVDKAIEIAAESDGKIIVFVHSKTTGTEICKKLRAQGVRAAFHNASLSFGMRSKIEAAFSKRDSGLNVLVSTSTLGAGVNLSLCFLLNVLYVLLYMKGVTYA